MSIFIGPAILILLVSIELIILSLLKKPIPWAEISTNLNSSQILMWLGRGLEVFAYHYLMTLMPYELTDFLGYGWVILIAFIVWDHQFYWLHNLHHRIPLLWYVHEVHHQGEHFNSSLGIRNSWFSSFTSLPFFLPMVAMGISVDIFVLVSSFHYFVQFYNHNDVIQHPKWMEKFFITPSLHKVHHGTNPEYLNKNCGGTLSIWDRLYNTHQKEIKGVPIQLGIKKSFSSGSPWNINILPFLKKERPRVKLNTNPVLNIGSFLLYIQLLGYIAVEDRIGFNSGLVFVLFIFFGTIIIGRIQEYKPFAKALWFLNYLGFGSIMFITDMYQYKPLLLVMAATGIYTIIAMILGIDDKSNEEHAPPVVTE